MQDEVGCCDSDAGCCCRCQDGSGLICEANERIEEKILDDCQQRDRRTRSEVNASHRSSL